MPSCRDSGSIRRTWFAPLLLLIAALSSMTAAPAWGAAPDRVSFVPWPRTVAVGQGAMALGPPTRIVATDAALVPLARILSGELFLITGRIFETAQGAPRDGDIALALDPALKREDYTLVVGKRADVRGGNYNAVAMGTVTLLQAIQTGADGRVALPTMRITDGPHFEYLATMIDTARKPHSIQVLRQCVDICRFYKIRYIHLHMTDENAWTFPSATYPKLGSGNFAWAGGEKPPVYDVTELTELIAYADARGVTFVPELETPGHSGQLRGTLPEIFGYKDDTGKTVTPGVSNMVRPEAYAAMDTLIGEAAAIFKSSPYIVVGGDEAGVGEAANFPEVKAYLAQHGLNDVGDLYTHYMGKLVEIARKHGKQAMVWEGPPLGRISLPKETIMLPWVGGSGAAAHMVKLGHRVVNPPWGVDKPYMNPYSVNGAILPRDDNKLIGTTSLIWQMPADITLTYMRSTAVLRQEPSYNPDSGRTYEDFLKRQAVTEARLDMLLHGFTLQGQGLHDPLTNYRLDPSFAGTTTLKIKTHLDPAKVRYTLDRGTPDAQSPAFNENLTLNKSTFISAIYTGDAAPVKLHPYVRTFAAVAPLRHDAIGAAVTLSPDNPGYPGPGGKALADGLQAVGNNYSQPGWVGWAGGPIVITLDLGRLIAIRDVSPHFLRSAGGVGPPKSVLVSLSTDGKTYRDAATVDEAYGYAHRGWYTADGKNAKARYVRLTITPGAEWTFLDEVAVNLTPPPRDVQHQALGCPVTFATEPNGYTAPGAAGMTDGYVSQDPNFLSLEWLGWEYKTIDATVDLGKVTPIHQVSTRFLQWVGAGIYIPAQVQVLLSDDGQTFRPAATIDHQRTAQAESIATLSASFKNQKARYVKIIAPTPGWLFVDEIMVNPSAKP
ncbi:MAG: family 20 glycosylhydrolase [Phycisphaeraceae bacterium]